MFSSVTRCHPWHDQKIFRKPIRVQGKKMEHAMCRSYYSPLDVFVYHSSFRVSRELERHCDPFIILSVPRLKQPTFLVTFLCRRSLPPSDERRLRRYLRTLTQRSAVCTLRCAPPAASSAAPPTVPTTLRQQPPRAAVPNRSAKTPALRPAGLHLH
jgi:hypothetical protein